MEEHDQAKKSMRRVREEYFGVPIQVESGCKLTPFYQNIKRMAQEEGLEFGTEMTSRGISGWTGDGVQPLIYRSRYRISLDKLFEEDNFAKCPGGYSKLEYLGFNEAGLRIPQARPEVVAYLDAGQFFINQDPQLRNLERKLREAYRIGYYIVEESKEEERKTKPLYTELLEGAEITKVPFEEIRKYLIEQIEGWGDRGLVDKKTIDHLTQNCLRHHELFWKAFEERRKQIDNEIDSAKKSIVVVPANYDPAAERKLAEKALRDFKKMLRNLEI